MHARGAQYHYSKPYDVDRARYLKPADEYVEPGVPLNFYTVVEAARRRGEVAVGYRTRSEADDPRKSYGLRLNPAKSRRITFAKGDSVIVLAES